jgi:Fe2+ transport system protein FeoA
MKAGDVGCVELIRGSNSTVRRMRELGLHVGGRIRMVRPGSPCIVQLDGQTLCFRSTELDNILIRPVPEAVGA